MNEIASVNNHLRIEFQITVEIWIPQERGRYYLVKLDVNKLNSQGRDQKGASALTRQRPFSRRCGIWLRVDSAFTWPDVFVGDEVISEDTNQSRDDSED